MNTNAVQISIGERGRKVICHSEAAIHLRVAGREMDFLVVPGAWGAAVQLLNADGTEYSFPILTGEAGLFRKEDGTYYYYPNDHGGN